jgi:hypothetical protein
LSALLADFSDYVEFASENYGDGSLADTNNNNLGNTPAERQRNQKLVNNNNQDYPNLIITIIAVRVFLVDNCYNCIWIDRRFFQSFLSGFV